ncbi:MAG TPA: ATP-binding protein [Actinomycetes bacterium]|nr:ATP-binding protein [Actinomycetes bacterium]
MADRAGGLRLAWERRDGDSAFCAVRELRSGRVAIALGCVDGDASGRSASHLAAALRAAGDDDLPPARALDDAGDALYRLDPAAIARCAYAVHDPVDGSLELALAGDLGVLLVDGASAVAPGEAGPPIGGASTGGRRQSVRAWPADATLVLCTGPLDPRAWQRWWRGGVSPHVEGLPGLLLDRLPAAGAAVLAARPDALLAPRVATLPLTAEPAGVRRAREFVARTLQEWGLAGDQVERARLVASELATNAVRYGGEQLSVHLALGPERLAVEVRDATSELPRGATPGGEAEGGRGLLLVGSLAQDWGARPLHPHGKAVWCRLPGASPQPSHE